MTELTTNVTISELKDVAAAIGAAQGASMDGGTFPDRMPVIKMWQHEIRKEMRAGKEIKEADKFFAHFFLKPDKSEDDPEKYVFAEKITFRPLSNVFQYFHFDFTKPVGEKLINKSIQLIDWSIEPRDIKGGIRCGKPTSAKMKDWEKEERDKYKDINCTRIIRGLATYTGYDRQGNKSVVENKPAAIMQNKGHFLDFDKQVVKQIPPKANIFDYLLDLVPNTDTNAAGNAFANWSYTPTFDKIEMDANKNPEAIAFFETLKVIREMINKENADVDKQYFEAAQSKHIDENAINALNQAAADDFEAAHA